MKCAATCTTQQLATLHRVKVVGSILRHRNTSFFLGGRCYNRHMNILKAIINGFVITRFYLFPSTYGHCITVQVTKESKLLGSPSKDPESCNLSDGVWRFITEHDGHCEFPRPNVINSLIGKLDGKGYYYQVKLMFPFASSAVQFKLEFL